MLSSARDPWRKPGEVLGPTRTVPNSEAYEVTFTMSIDSFHTSGGTAAVTASLGRTDLERPALSQSERSRAPQVARGGRRSRAPRSFPVAPIVTFVALWLGGSALVVGAWIHPVVPGGWLTLLALLALAIVPVRALIQGFRGAAWPSAATRLWVLRPFWYAMLAFPVLALSTLLGGVVGLPFGASGSAGRWALAAAAALVAVAALVGYVGSRRLVVRGLDVEMPRLPEAFDGLKAVQISDLHVGPHTPRRFLERVAQAVEAAEPDLVVITGDQVDDFSRDVEFFNAAFAGLRAPFGTFVVPGNHDVYAGWDGVEAGLSAAGFQVLTNEARPLELGGQRLWIAGTGDPAANSPLGREGHRAAPDVDRTLTQVPEGETVLALAHNPALWPALVRRGVDLTLSGHTHYGQFAIPSRNWSMASPFLDLAMGSHRAGNSLLYINPGTNYWGIPFRIGTLPEVTVLTLRSSHDGGAEIVASALGSWRRFALQRRAPHRPDGRWGALGFQ